MMMAAMPPSVFQGMPHKSAGRHCESGGRKNSDPKRAERI
jgi:hypothetical protein